MIRSPHHNEFLAKAMAQAEEEYEAARGEDVDVRVSQAAERRLDRAQLAYYAGVIL